MSVRDQIGSAGIGMERINIIRCGHDNDHRALRAALDVKRLGVHVTCDCSVEVQVARQVGCVARCEYRIDIMAVPGKIIVFLGNVDLRVCRKERSPQKNNDE